MKIKMTQHPVGQGGMMSGWIATPGESVRWVYDCGSNQTHALEQEIKIVGAGGPIHYLFLSHLDSDHVNGVDKLLNNGATIHEVVLPYLSASQRLILLAKDIADGKLTGDFIRFAQDPVTWFAQRGVERVTYISGGDDDDEEPPSPFTPSPRGEGPDKRTRYLEGLTPSLRSEWSLTADEAMSHAKISVMRMPAAAGVQITHVPSNFNWLLLPYAHIPSEKRLKAFMQAVRKKFPHRITTDGFLKIVGDKSTREHLRECYDRIWINHNLVSMALYAGPTEVPRTKPSIQTGYGDSDIGWWHSTFSEQKLGWLSTGDFRLAKSTRRRCFLKFYERLLAHVDALVLPHHGSAHDFHEELIIGIPNMRCAIAAAGISNPYCHPHNKVKEAVRSEGRMFHHVSEQGHSVAVLEAEL